MSRRFAPVAIAIILGLLCAGAAAASSPIGKTIRAKCLPDTPSVPVGSDGTLWTSCAVRNSAGHWTQYKSIPSSYDPSAFLIAAMPDDTAWLSFEKAQLTHVGADGQTLATVSIPNDNSGVMQLVPGPRGSLWYLAQTYDGRSEVGRLDQSGVLRVAYFRAQISSIERGPRSTMWMATGNSSLDELSDSLKLERRINVAPCPVYGGFAFGVNGSVWSTGHTNSICRHLSSGRHMTIALDHYSVNSVVEGSDGNVYTVAYDDNSSDCSLLRVTPRGRTLRLARNVLCIYLEATPGAIWFSPQFRSIRELKLR